MNMICVPEDADHPYGIEKIPVEIVDIKVDRPDLFEVQGWENGYVYLKSIGGDDSIFHSTTMTVAYKRLDNVLDTYSLSLMAYTWEYSGLLVSSSYTNRYAPTVKPGRDRRRGSFGMAYIYERRWYSNDRAFYRFLR